MSNYVDQFLAQCNQHSPSDQIYIFGFSFGAVISLIASTKIPITGQILCSLSPYFQEDLPLVPTRRKNYMGKRRIADFSTLSCDELVKKVNGKTYIVYGEHEHMLVISRSQYVHKNNQGSVIVPVVGGKHDISQDVYDEAIMRLFDTIKWR